MASEITQLCPSHGAVVPMQDGTCGWCGAPTRARQRRGGKPKGKYRLLTDDQVRAAHILYDQRGLSLRDLGRLLWERFGFASAASCANSLSDAFIEAGLPRRDRLAATVAASTTHGLTVGYKGKSRRSPEYNALRRERRDRRPDCKAVKVQAPGKGRPCSMPAMAGSEYCIAHDPERAEWRERNLAYARELLQLDEDLDARTTRAAA